VRERGAATVGEGPRRRGFTLLELLIVIHVIALLAIIAIPATGLVIRAARANQCAANLRQIGVGLWSYATAHGTFPPAAQWDPPGIVLSQRGVLFPGSADLTFGSEHWERDRFRASAFVSLLWHLDEPSLAEAWNSDVPVSAPHNATVRGRTLSMFLCPESGSDGRPCALQGGGWARGSYAINAGPDPGCLSTPFFDEHLGKSLPDWSCRAMLPQRPDVRGVEFAPVDVMRISQVWGSGIAGINRGFAPGDLTSGLSNTVLVDEILPGRSARDRRGCWAMPGIGPSSVFAHGSAVNGKDQFGRVAVDQVQDCTESDPETGPCEDRMGMSLQAFPRSRHLGGLNVLLGDGAIRFVADGADREVWESLHRRD
jgi:prepilin-type N-terminal cleavage/methylation domain-containing protein